MIRADALYRVSELRRLGIGSEELSEARRSGLVMPRLISGAHWYLGAEIIAWSETRRVEKGRSRAAGGRGAVRGEQVTG